MKRYVIELEDLGQDFTKIITDHTGEIIETRPFQTEHWKGGCIPIKDRSLFDIGKECPIHHPPHIEFGWLKYRIVRIDVEVV